MQCVTSHALGLFHACNRGHYVDMGGSLCGTPVAVFHEALRPDTVSASMQCMQLYKQPHARHHQTKHMQAEYTKAAQPLDTLAWPTSRRIESGHSLRVDAAPRSVGQRPMMLKTNEKPVRTARHADWSKLSKAAA